MNEQLLELTYEVELGPGEKLTLPPALVASVGPGRWIITVQPLPAMAPSRDHSPFLRGYGRRTRACTMTVQPGELWLADIRFTDASASKVRPVLVLWLDGLDAVVAAVTAAGPRSAMDVLLADWTLAGLRKPSTVRLSRLDCLERALLFRRLGRLSAVDAGRIRTTWDTHVKPQF